MTPEFEKWVLERKRVSYNTKADDAAFWIKAFRDEVEKEWGKETLYSPYGFRDAFLNVIRRFGLEEK